MRWWEELFSEEEREVYQTYQTALDNALACLWLM